MKDASKVSVSPARAAAFDILLRAQTADAFASELLHSERVDKLSSADRALCTELVMGTLRWQSLLDSMVAAASSVPVHKLDVEVLISLRLATYQLAELERIPARAAIHESVELVKRARKRSATAFANAVLRKMTRNVLQGRGLRDDSNLAVAGKEGDPASDLAQRYAHPRWMTARWLAEYGVDHARAICLYGQQVPQTALRLADPAAEQELRAEGVELGPGVFLRDARRVLSGDLTATRVYRQKHVFIQDEGSQLVAELVGRGQRLLDCCAAPGGKTAVLAAKNPASLVVAAELHPHRAKLARNLVSAQNVCVIVSDARAFPLCGGFDRVLADVPCSGTGTLARNPEIKWRLRPEDLPDLHGRQAAILNSALDQLAPGGRLVYSTCSLEPEENASVIEDVIAHRSDVALADCREILRELQDGGELVWRDLDSITVARFLRTTPGMHPCDGFFAAVLQKNYSSPPLDGPLVLRHFE